MLPYSLLGPSRSWQPPRRSAETVASTAIPATLELRILMDELLCSRYQNDYAASRFFFVAHLVAGALLAYTFDNDSFVQLLRIQICDVAHITRSAD
jgi:hypothetical protein